MIACGLALACELCGAPLTSDDAMLVGDEIHAANAGPACGAFALALIRAGSAAVIHQGGEGA